MGFERASLGMMKLMGLAQLNIIWPQQEMGWALVQVRERRDTVRLHWTQQVMAG